MNRVPISQGKHIRRFYQRGNPGTGVNARSAGICRNVAQYSVTYNTPQLIAMAAPILSLSRICNFMRMNQGRMASAISAAPE